MILLAYLIVGVPGSVEVIIVMILIPLSVEYDSWLLRLTRVVSDVVSRDSVKSYLLRLFFSS